MQRLTRSTPEHDMIYPLKPQPLVQGTIQAIDLGGGEGDLWFAGVTQTLVHKGYFYTIGLTRCQKAAALCAASENRRPTSRRRVSPFSC